MAEIVIRDTHASAIARPHIFATADNFPTKLMREVRTRTSHLHDQWERLQTAHVNVIRTLDDDEQRAPHLEIFTRTENQFLSADAILQERIAEVENAVVDHQSNDDGSDNDESDDHQSQADRHHDTHRHRQPNRSNSVTAQSFDGNGTFVVQPTAQLPWQYRMENTWGEFDGDRKKWPAFYESFLARIYKNPTLTLVEKFQILRAALKGKAAKALGEWQIRGCFFEPAWNRLMELYDDPYGTSKEHFQRIFSLKKLDSPHGERLQNMSNVTQEVSRQLKALGYPSEHYDLMLIHSVQAKLDDKTSVAWDLQRQSDHPTLAEFTKFLDRRAKALTNAFYTEVTSKSQNGNARKRPFDSGNQSNGSRSGKGSGKSYQGDSKRFKSNHTQSHHSAPKAESTTCACCSDDHVTRKCPKFLQLNLTKRKDEARAANLCFNCLSPGHNVKECKVGKCTRCEKKHNSLLCPENPNNRHLTVGQVATQKKKPKKNGKTAQPKPQ